jgi:hypothetical protein
MSQARFEPTTPAFERAKTFHALKRAATVIGSYITIEDGSIITEPGWLDSRGFGVRFPVVARESSLLHSFHIGSGPVQPPMVIWDAFSEGEAA